jgi:hypothetical protein
MSLGFPTPLRRPRPGLADVQCSRLKFEPGDRVLVRTYHNLSKEQKRKWQRIVQKWAGVDVEVLVINCMEMEIEVVKRRTISDT